MNNKRTTIQSPEGELALPQIHAKNYKLVYSKKESNTPINGRTRRPDHFHLIARLLGSAHNEHSMVYNA